ncbi:MAG: hybrid sensor histidine kinase/response regulator [Anaerolineae bacterium]|nr:hybrid sensor histidine kinase/response regulator [Anaerolineae bacterium]
MLKILTIEDNALVRKLIKKSLCDEYVIVEAEDGLTGVRQAQEHRPDLIICDIAMPGMDGFEVLTTLNDQPETQMIPFIFLTALHEKRLMRQGMELGADDFLTKPFTVEELRHAVEARLKKKSVQAAAVNRTLEDLRLNIARSLPHEFRTAIMVADGYAHLIESESDGMTEEQKSMLMSIRSSMGRLYKMAENFLWYSRTEFMNATVREFTDEPDTIIEAVARMQARAFSRPDDLILSVEKARLSVSYEQLKKITEELVENAFKFSDPGTPVHVVTGIEGEYYALAISNYGRGLKPENIEKINGFMQFDRDTYEQQGIGLGLTIVKRLVETSGGQMVIQSFPEEKTTVVVYLPYRGDS